MESVATWFLSKQVEYQLRFISTASLGPERSGFLPGMFLRNKVGKNAIINKNFLINFVSTPPAAAPEVPFFTNFF